MLPQKIIIVEINDKMTAHDSSDILPKGIVTSYERHHLLAFYECIINNKPITQVFGQKKNESKQIYNNRLAYLYTIVTKVFLAVNLRFFYIDGNPISSSNGFCELCRRHTRTSWEAYIKDLQTA